MYNDQIVVQSEDDGMLLIIPVRIYGKVFCALVDSRAFHSFVLPRVVRWISYGGSPMTVSLS